MVRFARPRPIFIKFASPRPLFALPQTFIPLWPQNLYLRRTWWRQLVVGNVLSAHRGRQPVNTAKEVVTTQVVRASASACRWSAAQADMRMCVWVDRCTLCQYPSTFVSVLATKRSETFFAPKLAVGGSNPQISPPHRCKATTPCALTRAPDDRSYNMRQRSPRACDACST